MYLTKKDNGKTCSESKASMREHINNLLRQTPQTDPIQDLAYQQAFRDAIRGNRLKFQYAHKVIDLFEYLEKEKTNP